jgi:hypothetical protein
VDIVKLVVSLVFVPEVRTSISAETACVVKKPPIEKYCCR